MGTSIESFGTIPDSVKIVVARAFYLVRSVKKGGWISGDGIIEIQEEAFA